MTAPTPLPTYIYKILPSSPPPPSPLPEILPLSSLDARDNFIHLSTSAQILGTLQNFFTTDSHVYILRIPYDRVAKFIKWEDAIGKQPDEKGGCWDVNGEKGFFPHVHGNAEGGGCKLGREDVLDVGKWERGSGTWGKGGWPFEEDVPKE